MSQAGPACAGSRTVPSYVIMQPTTLCNLDCTYCYLPLRAARPADAGRGGRGGRRRRSTTGPRDAPRFSVVWHGGEPLAAGRDAPRRADGAVRRRRAPHPDQRHADRRRLVRVLRRARYPGRAVSIDGPRELTGQRVDSRRPPGVRPDPARASTTLRRHGIPFAALCVVSDPRPGPGRRAVRVLRRPRLPRRSASTSRSRRASTSAPTPTTPSAVRAFWAELTARLAADPRDRGARGRVGAAVRRGGAGRRPPTTCCPAGIDPIPTIAYDGRVVLLSPELAGFTDARVRRLRLRQRAATRRWPRSWPAAAGADRLDRRVPRPASRRAGPAARTSASAAARTPRTGTSSTAGSTAPRPSTAATARSRLLEGVLDHARAS